MNLNPSELQPSGACNFSRIDNSILELIIGKKDTDDKGEFFKNNYKNGNVRIYANNYNLLEISDMRATIKYNS